MTIVLTALMACVVLALLGERVWRSRHVSDEPLEVEGHSIVPEPGERPAVIVTFIDPKGRAHVFRIHAAYGHMMSDDLICKAARAIRPPTKDLDDRDRRVVEAAS
jgi:hypothetical protein